MEGSWTPDKATINFTVSQSQSGWDWSGTGTPAGGLIIVKNGGVYHVTLVSANGQRYAAQASMQGAYLGVYFGFDSAFFLYQFRPGRLELLDYANDKPVKDPQFVFVRGTPTSAPTGSMTLQPASP